MKNQTKRFIITIMSFTLCILLQAAPAQAATLEKEISVYTNKTRSVSFRRDLTGDGIAEKITVTAKKPFYSFYKNLSVSVNGKTVATLKPRGAFDSFHVQYISMSSKKNFL